MIYQTYEHISISGDFNEHANNPKALISYLNTVTTTKIFEGKCLEGVPPTHERGSEAIYHIWVSMKSRMQTIDTHMYPFGAWPESDHRPIHTVIRMTCNKKTNPETIPR